MGMIHWLVAEGAEQIRSPVGPRGTMAGGAAALLPLSRGSGQGLAFLEGWVTLACWQLLVGPDCPFLSPGHH